MSRSDRLALAIASGALALPPHGTITVLRAAPSTFLGSLPHGRLVAEQSFRPIYDALAAHGLPVTVRAEGPAAAVVVNLVRSRGENEGNLARGLGMLRPGGTLVADGAKTEGIDALAHRLGEVLPLDGAFAKAHGRVFWLRRPEALPAAVTAWAEAAAPRRNAEGFVTTPGLFSPEEGDPGSRRLADALPGRLHGRVADLGGGWGWLAHAALSRCPEITGLDLHEAEARALDAARLNVRDPRAAFHWTDVATLGRGTPPYDAVITNPPFHHARAARPDLGVGFIAAAARILKPAGRLLLVANRQLPYEAALQAAFRHVERLSEDRAFKVMLAERPRSAHELPPARRRTAARAT